METADMKEAQGGGVPLNLGDALNFSCAVDL